jgi:hypothetical protein
MSAGTIADHPDTLGIDAEFACFGACPHQRRPKVGRILALIRHPYKSDNGRQPR